MKKKSIGKKTRQNRKSAVARATVRKKLFSKRRGGVIHASMILENRNMRGENPEANKKDII
jgi:hypothetical protein